MAQGTEAEGLTVPEKEENLENPFAFIIPMKTPSLHVASNTLTKVKLARLPSDLSHGRGTPEKNESLQSFRNTLESAKFGLQSLQVIDNKW